MVGSAPHVSLSKSCQDSWKDLGPFVKACLFSVNWVPTGEDDVMYNSDLAAYRSTFDRRLVPVFQTVHIVQQEGTELPNYVLLSEEEFKRIEALKEVHSIVWAKHKYDVGLIRGAQPVEITPKSSYRPCQPQYSLKQEAIDGITPVFESLKKDGVIVPCENSPVQTPIFPVKKIREAGQPTEWRFVQDLQAVNAAVQPRASNVPNPYTILSQVLPSGSLWSIFQMLSSLCPYMKKVNFGFHSISKKKRIHLQDSAKVIASHQPSIMRHCEEA